MDAEATLRWVSEVIMDAKFWLQRWREGQIGFHQSRVTPLLQESLVQSGAPAGSRVLIPLAGKSLSRSMGMTTMLTIALALTTTGGAVEEISITVDGERILLGTAADSGDLKDERLSLHRLFPYGLLCAERSFLAVYPCFPISFP